MLFYGKVLHSICNVPWYSFLLYLEYVQLTQACGHMKGSLSVSVGLIDIDVGHGEELVESLPVVLFDRAEDCRQHKVVALGEEEERSFIAIIKSTRH